MAVRHRVTPIAIVILAFLAAEAALALPNEGSVVVKSESAATEGAASLSVSASVRNASLELNRRYVGRLPLELEGLEPGNYLVGVGAPGYQDFEYAIVLEEKTAYTLYFLLAPRTGYLDLDVSPEDAEIRIDGLLVEDRVFELPVGSHEIAARRFGYESKKIPATIHDGIASRIRIDLAPAPFSISAIEPGRRAFNPANAGSLGRTNLSFTATNYGSARMEIRDSSGTLVAACDFPRIETWKQGFEWRGRGPDGSPLPDGSYEAVLTASPEGHAAGDEAGSASDAGAPLVVSARIRIDSSLVYRAPGSIAALPGSLLFPDPEPIPAGGFASEFAWLASAADASESAFAIGTSFSLGGRGGSGRGAAAFTLGAAAETAGDPEGDLALSLIVPLVRRANAAAAIFARGSWSSAASPVLPGSLPGAELSAPLSLGFGPLSLGLSPGLLLDLSGAEPEARTLARAALWLSGPAYRAGVSACLEFGGGTGAFSPSWPALVCAEVRAILAPSPFVASAYALCELEPDSAAGLVLGLGFGFLL